LHEELTAIILKDRLLQNERSLLMKHKGFTLIELLIVVAIILILLAVALPSFQDAQTLADLGQTRSNMIAMNHAMKAHLADHGSVPADYNDSYSITIAYRARSAVSPVCSIQPDPDATEGGLVFPGGRSSTYANGVHCPLTSPVQYISPEQTFDPFSDGTVPFGYDSREASIFGSPVALQYGGFFSAGPDKQAGDWVRGCDGGTGCAFNPTNGVTSKGDFWGVVTECEYGSNPMQPCLAENDFPIQYHYPAGDSETSVENWQMFE
jgi:prepilin-type N-terminal cleavage/methylation domain-containing protein